MKRYFALFLLLSILFLGLAGCGEGKSDPGLWVKPLDLTQREETLLQSTTEFSILCELGEGQYTVTMYRWERGTVEETGSVMEIPGEQEMLIGKSAGREALGTSVGEFDWVCTVMGDQAGGTYRTAMTWDGEYTPAGMSQYTLAEPLALEAGVDYVIGYQLYSEGNELSLDAFEDDVFSPELMEGMEFDRYVCGWVLTITGQ